MKYLFVAFVIMLASCNWAKQKTKETVNKTGEVVAKTGSEFVDGVAEGIDKSFSNKIELSDQLTKLGMSTGKISIHGTDSTTDNVLTAYLIFDEDFNKNITVKAMNSAGQEYGRVTQNIQGQKGEAKYVDFIFDIRTNLEWKGKITME